MKARLLLFTIAMVWGINPGNVPPGTDAETTVTHRCAKTDCDKPTLERQDATHWCPHCKHICEERD